MNEQQKYKVIKKLVDENGNKNRAAVTLGITRRQVNRLIVAYKKHGKAAFVHGNRGRMLWSSVFVTLLAEKIIPRTPPLTEPA